jgi:hypothetical protein
MECNTYRPHLALGGLKPVEFKGRWTEQHLTAYLLRGGDHQRSPVTLTCPSGDFPAAIRHRATLWNGSTQWPRPPHNSSTPQLRTFD